MILDESLAHPSLEDQLKVVYIALAWSVLAIVMAWRQGLFKPFIPQKSSLISGLEVTIGFAIFTLLQMVIMPTLIVLGIYFFTGRNIQLDHLQPLEKFWIGAGNLIAGYIPLALYYMAFFSKEQKQVLFGSQTKWYKDYLFGASTWLAAFPVVVLWGKLMDIFIQLYFKQTPSDQVVVEQFRLIKSHPFLLLCMSLIVATIVPLAEEFLFRGLLQSWLKSKLRSVAGGIMGSSLVFALFHYSTSQGITNIEFLSSLFLLSCFLGYLYEKRRSLWVSVGLHSVFNLISAFFIISESK